MNSSPRWLSRLQLDTRSRRAIAETLIDSRTEARAATTMAGKCGWVLRTTVAIGRVLAFASLREVGAVLRPVAVLWLIGIPLTIFAAVTAFSMWTLPYRHGWPTLSLVVEAMTLFLPIGAYVAAIAEAPRRQPTLGLLVVASGLTAAGMTAFRSAGVPGTGLVWMWALLTAVTASLLLVAGRAALEPRRWVVAALALVVPALAFGAYANIRLTLAIAMSGPGQTVHVGWELVGAYVISWWGLVRYQEARTQTGTLVVREVR